MAGDQGQYGVRGYLTAQGGPALGPSRLTCRLLVGMLRAELMYFHGKGLHQIRVFFPIAIGRV